MQQQMWAQKPKSGRADSPGRYLLRASFPLWGHGSIILFPQVNTKKYLRKEGDGETAELAATYPPEDL